MSLLTAKDRQLHPRGQIAKLVRIGRRATCKAEWIDTMLGEPTGDRRDPAFGYYARATENAGPEHELYWRRERRLAIKDRDAARAKAAQAAAEIAAIAAEHGIRP